MASLFPTNEEDFIQWFWNGTNGNELIHKLNAYSFNVRGYSGDFIRKEKNPASIYGIDLDTTLADKVLPKSFEKIKSLPRNIRLIMIGFNENNPMEQAFLDLNSKFSGYGIHVHMSFIWPISFVDTTAFSEVEDHITGIRKKMGVCVPQALGEKLRLPFPKEWVLTSDDVIKALMQNKETMESKEGAVIKRVVTTEIFRKFRYGMYDTSLDEVASGLICSL